jgi:hypothetical protein
VSVFSSLSGSRLTPSLRIEADPPLAAAPFQRLKPLHLALLYYGSLRGA